MPLFPEPTGFVEECLKSVGIITEDTITCHKLFELAIHVKGEFSSFNNFFCGFCWCLSVFVTVILTATGNMSVTATVTNCDRNCDCDCNFITV